jgi:hypothetical protein
MITNTRITHSISSVQLEADLGSLRRLLVAAAISPAYCRLLLDSPAQAVREGFGGEAFPLTGPTLETISAIRAATLVDFIHSINEKIPIL